MDNAFGAALDRFFAVNPKAPRDPAGWTVEQRATFEPAILDAYRDTRGLRYGGSTMTDANKRAEHLMGPSSPLSAEPGSFRTTGRP